MHRHPKATNTQTAKIYDIGGTHLPIPMHAFPQPSIPKSDASLAVRLLLI